MRPLTVAKCTVVLPIVYCSVAILANRIVRTIWIGAAGELSFLLHCHMPPHEGSQQEVIYTSREAGCALLPEKQRSFHVEVAVVMFSDDGTSPTGTASPR